MNCQFLRAQRMRNILRFQHNPLLEASAKAGAFIFGVDQTSFSRVNFQLRKKRWSIVYIPSFKISFAANMPAAPMTPPPGCAPLAPK
jgi:hypothetical protein